LAGRGRPVLDAFVEFGYLGLFASAFLAATILPLSSEVVLTTLLLAGLPAESLVGVATVGNVLGSVVNYALGYWAGAEVAKRWLKLSEDAFVRAERRFVKYGVVSLFFAWVPVIGDPLTLVAGVLRVRLWLFLLIVTIGKLSRYVVIAYLAQG
jgi:membrane protein YqaA with SNARE-associated domain